MVTELKNVSVKIYIDYLNKLEIVFGGKPKPNNQEVKHGDLYWYKVGKKDYAFPRHFWNKYILLRFVWVFPSTSSLLGSHWLSVKGQEQSEFSTVFTFCVLNVVGTKEEVTSNSKLRGFRRLYNDNEFFSHIPTINHITHWDNGIISNSIVEVDYKLNENVEEWGKFGVYHSSKIVCDKGIIKGTFNHDVRKDNC